jgi:hypothetical protein
MPLSPLDTSQIWFIGIGLTLQELCGMSIAAIQMAKLKCVFAIKDIHSISSKTFNYASEFHKTYLRCNEEKAFLQMLQEM